MKTIFLNNWKDADANTVFSDFEVSAEDQRGVELLLAYYNMDGYEGDAFVLFKKDGKIYEAHGSHCSCYGLEGQWKPEEVSLKELRNRIENGTFGYYSDVNIKQEILSVLDSLV